MCLDTIQEKVEDWKVGYKVFGFLPPQCGGPRLIRCCAGRIDKTRPEGEWIHEKDYRNSWDDNETIEVEGEFHYRKGWHVFETLKSAQTYLDDVKTTCETIRKVKCRGAVATGSQDNLKTGVFKEIFILAE